MRWSAIQISLCGDFTRAERTNGTFIFPNGISKRTGSPERPKHYGVASALVNFVHSKGVIDLNKATLAG
jgi:hypothetical protein